MSSHWFEDMQQKPMATKKRRTIFITEHTPTNNHQRLLDYYSRVRAAEREAEK